MASRSLNVVITGDARGFRGAVNQVERDTDRLDKSMRRANRSTSDASSGFDGLSVRVGALSGSLTSMAPTIATATPALGALAGAAAALGSSLASAAAGAGALGVGFGASMAPVLVLGKQVTSRFEDIKKAYDDVQTAQREGTAESKKNADQALANLSKSERAMVGSFGKLSALQDKVLGPASDRIIGSLSKVIDTLAPALEKLAGPFEKLGGAIGGAIERVADLLSGPVWSDAFKSFVDNASKIVGPVTTIFLSVANIIRDVAVSALPLVNDALKDAARFFGDLDDKATRSKIRDIVRDLVDQTKSWFGLFAAVGGLIGRVFGSGADEGKGLVDRLTDIVNAVNGFVDGMHKGAGAGGDFASKVKAAFEIAKGAFETVKRVVGGLRDTITRWVDKNREDIDSVIGAFRAVGKFAKTVFQETLWPIIKNTIGAIGDAISGLVSVFRGVIRAISGLVSGDWDKAWDGIKEAVRGAFKVVKSLVKGALDAILEIIKDWGPDLLRLIGKGMLNIGKAVATGIGRGLGSLGHLILDKVKDALSFAADNLPGPAGLLGKGIGKIVGDGVGKTVSIVPPTSAASGGNALMGAKSTLGWVASAAGRFGLHTSSGLRPGSITSSGNKSFHSSGDALDEAGSPAGMLGFFRYMKAKYGPVLRELIHTPGGVGIKDGRPFTYSGQVAQDHYDHVHVAFTGGAGDGTGRAPGTGDGIGQIKSLWTRAGGSARAQNLAAAVAMAESGGNPGASNRNSDGSIDRGLWQINSVHGALSTFDRLGNARAAVSISSNGRNWQPWVAYTSGAYRKFLSAAGNVKSGKAKSSKPRSGSDVASGPYVYDPAAPYAAENAAAENGPDPFTGVRPGAAGFTQRMTGGGPAGRPIKGGGPTKGFPIGYVPPEPVTAPAGPTAPDFIRAAIAEAALTPGTEDDLAALIENRSYAGGQLELARRSGDPRLIAEAAENFKSTIDAVDALTEAVKAQTDAIEEQRKSFERLIAEDYRARYNVSQSQYAILAQAITDVTNGSLGQRLGLSLSGLRAAPGAVARA